MKKEKMSNVEQTEILKADDEEDDELQRSDVRFWKQKRREKNGFIFEFCLLGMLDALSLVEFSAECSAISMIFKYDRLIVISKQISEKHCPSTVLENCNDNTVATTYPSGIHLSVNNRTELFNLILQSKQPY